MSRGDGRQPPPDPITPIVVELALPSAAWASMAEREGSRLKEALGPLLVIVHHVGSTSIPGIAAKPIIDLIPVVTGLAAFDERRGALRALGYRWHGELGIPRRRYCTFTDPVTGRRVCQLHVFAAGDPQIDRHIAFRDYLRAHPGLARAYEAEKRRAAVLHPGDVNAYNQEKDAWIKRVEREALESREPRPRE